MRSSICHFHLYYFQLNWRIAANYSIQFKLFSFSLALSNYYSIHTEFFFVSFFILFTFFNWCRFPKCKSQSTNTRAGRKLWPRKYSTHFDLLFTSYSSKFVEYFIRCECAMYLKEISQLEGKSVHQEY